ncbi:helix-turn-helix transcriptional regulator [Adlercreutzia caecimuris]|uniref:helix-turn-helix transcriptional regulator n=1 Tax=Adlercreutzia caecimuris TaxID=671266 RepID=UPI002494072D|nr:helix-turn-helix transcriptional regulator [Adlercreutzia caecimuris]
MSRTTPVARATFTHLHTDLRGAPPRPVSAPRSLPYLIGALTAFGAACALGGGACSIALGNPASTDALHLSLIAGALACAAGFIAIGIMLALRQRDLRRQEMHLASRAELIRRELDALGLTPRETTIAELILQHRSYDEIAVMCRLSPRTVQFHASNIFRKAYVTRRREFERIMLADENRPEPYERIARIRPSATEHERQA